MTVNQRIGVLFVCTGNICRSPTAEAVFRHHVESAGWSDVIAIASAGTHGYHIGDPPDIRAQDAGLRRRYDLSRLRARQVEARDFERFDYLLAMDRANLAELRRIAPRTLLSRAKLFLDFGSKGVQEVPDPYYGADEGFEHVLDLIEDASRGLLAHLQQCIDTDRRSSS